MSLSEKIAEHQGIDLNWIDVEDVKEFIRLLKLELLSKSVTWFIKDNELNPNKLISTIDKLAGSSLI